jgi:hypothetical protein
MIVMYSVNILGERKMKVGKFLTLMTIFLLLFSTFAMVCRSYTAAQEPEATLTGNILDRGVDTNGNGLYDYLEVDVQINVTQTGDFRVVASNLIDEFGNSIPVYNSTEGLLETGVQYLNISFFGPTIFGYFSADVQKVGFVQLYDSNYKYLGSSLYNVVLSRVYHHGEFDPHAFLTGRISDRGVDTDGDSLFNYLEVGLEFNATQAGRYDISAGGLMEETETTTNYFSEYQNVEQNFTVGVHTVDMNFSGPGIASQHLNPTKVNYIRVYDVTNQVQTGARDAAPLSMRYNCTLFNAPSKDIQVNFKVYPDATVAVDGALNFTHMYPDNRYGPQTNMTVGFSTTGNWTTETSNGTIVFPNSPYVNYNAIEEHMRSSYENGLENDAINASMILTPEEAGFYPFNTTDIDLKAAYSGGWFDVAINGQTVLPTIYGTVFPFNTSDATVRADFDGTRLKGNITFHAIPGFPFADIRLDFNGNRSKLQFTGNINITYTSFDGFEINETILDQKLADLTANITGHGPGSLDDVTGGYLECTNLNVTKNPWSNPTLGADVECSATAVGNFTGAIARMTFPPGSPMDEMQQFAYASLESAASSVRRASLVLSYYHNLGMAQVDLHLTSDIQALCNSLLLLVPPVIPPSMLDTPSEAQARAIEAWLKIANASAYALTDGGFNASYSSADRKMSVNAWLSANASQLKNDLIPFMPDAVPPNMHDLLESYLNTTYYTLNSSMTTFDMVNGWATFASKVTVQGDFEAELNRDKRFLIAALLSPQSTSLFEPRLPPLMTPIPWEFRLLNETGININNFQAQFGLGQDWMYANFTGLILKPQADNVDFITFKLKNWLNMTADLSAPPLDFGKFTITVTGASNANQTILLSQPSDVPAPDHFSGDYRSMVWNNASLSSLKDLTFLIAYQKQINYNSRTYDIPILTNSTVTSLVFNPDAEQITFDVIGPAGTGFCNVTIPKTLLNATSIGGWIVTFDGEILTSGEFNITENAEYVFVYLNYNHSEHVITIRGTSIVSEFQPDILPLALIIPFVIVAIIAIRQRRKIQLLKTKCRQTLARVSASLRLS